LRASLDAPCTYHPEFTPKPLNTRFYPREITVREAVDYRGCPDPVREQPPESGLGQSETPNHVRGDGSFPPKRSP
jgi:hypothetical protein